VTSPNSDSPRETHPDFDGHLEWPLLRMTPEQRLEWLWQMLELKWNATLVDSPPKSREPERPRSD